MMFGDEKARGVLLTSAGSGAPRPSTSVRLEAMRQWGSTAGGNCMPGMPQNWPTNPAPHGKLPMSKSSSAPQILRLDDSGCGAASLGCGGRPLQRRSPKGSSGRPRPQRGERPVSKPAARLSPKRRAPAADCLAGMMTRSHAGDVLFPPLFEENSRTRAALWSGVAESRLLANVIGSNYSPSVASLTVDPALKDPSCKGATAIRWKRPSVNQVAAAYRAVDRRVVDFTKEWPTIVKDSPVAQELDEAGITKQEFCKTLSRYKSYLDGHIPQEVLAPYNKQWLDHAIFLLDSEDPAHLPDVAKEQRAQVLSEMKKEVLGEYSIAARKAILDYALLDEACRRRLDVAFSPSPPSPWGGVPFTVPDIGTFGGPPPEWVASLGAARSSLLGCMVRNNQTSLSLQAFWLDHCAHVRMLHFPQKHRHPVEISEFHTEQAKQLDKATHQLFASWDQVVRILAAEPVYFGPPARPGTGTRPGTAYGGGADRRPEALFLEAAASQLSLLARGVVERSLQEYVELFERFAAEPLHYEAVKALRDTEKWQDEILLNRLVVSRAGGRSGVCFKHDLHQMTSRLLLPYSECTASLRELVRPETRLRDMLGGRTRLFVVREEEDHIREGHRRVEKIVTANLASAEMVLELYEPFRFLLDEEAKVAEFVESEMRSREEYRAYVRHLRGTLDQLQRQCPREIRTQMMRVDAREANKVLAKCGERCVQLLLTSIAVRNRERSNELLQDFRLLENRILRVPRTEEELVEFEACVEDASAARFPALLGAYEDVKAWLFLAWDLDHLLVQEDYEAVYECHRWTSFASNIAKRQVSLQDDRARIERELDGRKMAVEEDVTGIIAKVNKFKDKGSIRMLEEYLEQLGLFKRLLAANQKIVVDIQQKEDLIGWGASEFEIMLEAHTALEPFDRLWTLVRDQQQLQIKWLRTPLFGGDPDLRPEVVNREFGELWQTVQELRDLFAARRMPKPAHAAAKVREELQQFERSMPLFRAFLNPSLQSRHWGQISHVLGFHIGPDDSLTLERVLDMDVGAYVAEIVEVSDGASKEREISNDLDAQLQEWQTFRLLFEGEGGASAVSEASLEQCQTLLDQQTVRTQALKRSPYVAEEDSAKIQDWESFLREVQEVIHVWLRVQYVWQDLAPLMSAEALEARAPTEARLLRETELLGEACEDWSRLVSDSYEAPSALALFRQRGLAEELRSVCEKLEALQQGSSPREDSC